MEQDVLGWCEAIFGSFEFVSDQTRSHPGDRTETLRLHTREGNYYVKTFRDRLGWEKEVHGYEQWAPVFQGCAPQLRAVRDREPLTLVISELPGQIMEETQFTPAQERAIWRRAGEKLAPLHKFAVGEAFGPCRRDGSRMGTPVRDAVVYLRAEFDDLLERGQRGGFLTADERAIVNHLCELIPAFTGERPVPCHRDYCPANWLVSPAGEWIGVIDFEFAHWDVRTTDFSRYPGWEWVHRPDLIAAFFDGYGRPLTLVEEQQRLVTHAQYALGAIVWGEENEYHGFAAEGREALKWLGRKD